MAIITSVLDNDFYKFTMAYAIYKNTWSMRPATYEFICRSPKINWRPYLKTIQEEILSLGHIRGTQDEVDYLNSLGYFDTAFTETFNDYIFNPLSYVNCYLDTENNLRIHVSGPWGHVMFFEVPILAIVNQVYADNINPDGFKAAEHSMTDIVLCKTNELSNFKFADFGTRRRRSLEWQREVLNMYRANAPASTLVGTSNVYLAKELNLKPIGTMAHEWIQAGQPLAPSLKESQTFMLQKWADVYRGKLGIALSDTLGSDKFFKDFDGYFARLYDGVRQDSGHPVTFGIRLIKHYEKLGIDPLTKTLVFSDSLNFEGAAELYKFFSRDIKVLFGIGTKFTNNFEYPNGPLNIVIKLVNFNEKPVAKISDDAGKAVCEDEEYLKRLKEEIL